MIYIDYGDTCIQVSKAENTENIVRMIAATGKVEEFPRQTNVSLATEGGEVLHVQRGLSAAAGGVRL